jgi:hypothetical protein
LNAAQNPEEITQNLMTKAATVERNYKGVQDQKFISIGISLIPERSITDQISRDTDSLNN